MLKVIKNTYLIFPNILHAEIGEEVYWLDLNSKGRFLKRKLDNQTLFAHNYKKDKDYKVMGWWWLQ